MPGIVGLVTDNPDQAAAKQQVTRMMRTMLHDASYSQGTYYLPEQGCYLGWINHSGSYADCNPIVDERGDVVLIFSGEHFAHGGDGPDQASARCLLKRYKEVGDRFVNEINGWFSGVVVDHRSHSILLFNDRFGINRIYIHESREAITFASEAKAILCVRPETRTLDPQALGHFLGFGAVFDNRTLFAGVSLMPGGACWSLSRPSVAAVKKFQYFHPSTWESQPLLDPATFYRALRDTTARILPSYFRAWTPVGLSLTGGLDTRIVMAGIPADAEPMPAYTYGGVYRDCFDVEVARKVAAACGQQHTVLPLDSDFFERFDTFAEETVWLTDGCLDVCGTHEIYFSKQARALSPVRLTGNYGSEVLRSISTFKYKKFPDPLLDPAAAASVADGARSFALIRAEHPVTFAAFREIPWNLFGRLSAAQSLLVLRSPYMDNELVALLYQAPPGTRETNLTSLRLIEDLNPRLAAIPTDLGYGGHTPAPLAKLRQIHRYLLFKAEWYYNTGMPPWLAKFDGAPPLTMLEPLFLGRHKIDHYRLWFRDRLASYARAMLSDAGSRSRPYLNRRGYDDLVRAQTEGHTNSVSEINKLMTLELIQRVLIERDYGT